MSEGLEKKAQEKLVQARQLLREAAKLAEEGGFEISFNSPGTRYYPKSLFSDEVIMDYLREQSSEEEIAGWSPEELEEAKEGARAQLKRDELPEYAELGEWWMPSRMC